jgi:hypothetical protein
VGASSMISQSMSFLSSVLSPLMGADEPDKMQQGRTAAAQTPFVVEIEGLDERSPETVDRRRYCAKLHVGAVSDGVNLCLDDGM